METKRETKYGWVLVAIIVFATFTYQMLQYQMSVVQGTLQSMYSIDEAAYSNLFNSPMWPAVFCSIILGLIIDKFGCKWAVAICMLVAAIGGVCHAFAGSYSVMYVTVLMTGFGATAINVASGKLFSSWLPPKMFSVGMGCFLSASTVGQFVAQSTTNLFASLTPAFWMSGLCCAVVFVLWLVFGKNQRPAEGQDKVEGAGIGETLLVCVKSYNNWLCAVGLFFILGGQVLCNAFIHGCKVAQGMDPVSAGVLVSIISAGNLCGSLFMPMFAAKVGKDKPFIIAFAVICAIGYAFAWRLTGVACYVAFFIMGLCASALMPFFFSMPVKFKDVGPRYAGTATGIISTLELAGALVLPGFIVPKCMGAAGLDYSKFFLIDGAVFILVLVIALLLPETGWKANEKTAA